MLVHSDAGFWELAPPGSNGDVALRTEGVLLRVLSGFRRSHASKPLSAVARSMGFQRNIAAMRSITSGESRIERLTTEEFPSLSLNLLGRLQDLPTIYGTSGFANHLAKFRKWGNIISGAQVEYAMGCKWVVIGISGLGSRLNA